MARGFAVLAVGAALALPAASTAASSGLRGVVMRGPIQPVCRVGQPCDAPAKHMKLVFTRAGHSFTATTNELGRYRILLAPGRYSVVVAGVHFGYTPRTALVPAGRIAVRNFAIDTGIR